MSTNPARANAFQNPDKLVAQAVANLKDSVVLAGMFDRRAASEFVNATGQVINIRRPGRLKGAEEAIDAKRKFNDTSTWIQSENLNEGLLTVKLDTHAYSAVDLSDAELSLDLLSFGEQVMVPQVDSITERLENKVATAMTEFPEVAASAKIPVDLTKATSDEAAGQMIRKALARLRVQLNRENVPAEGRAVVLGSEAAFYLLNSPNVLSASEHADGGAALKESSLGRIHGFRLVESTNDKLNPLGVYAFHRSAIQLVSGAPSVPESAKGGRQNADGFALRWIKDYNSGAAMERSFLSSYWGATLVTDLKRGETDWSKPANLVKVRGVKVTFTGEPKLVLAA
ncbi:P22 phage major capsid protein family protein [Kitasatospora sp. MBT66]|uniref:P22 phage major capsid protein family protein n=1 Tax=Kitasatospora sp. MBT66 TaxID=1444769 RepID=UPI0009E68853|nr:P22 phage major capsid protein family protein [Kitasatospora sp. MBT66]